MSDDNENFRVGQTAHAANVRAERHIMAQLGTTREQARTVLHTAKIAETQRTFDRQRQESTPQRTPPPKIETETTSFAPTRLTLEGTAKGNDGTPGKDGKSTPVGTAVSPYVMGANRTTSDPDPADDTWDITSPPEGTDGVIFDPFRSFPLESQSVYITDADRTIISVIYRLMRRQFIVNSTGQLIYISVETFVGNYSEVTIG